MRRFALSILFLLPAACGPRKPAGEVDVVLDSLDGVPRVLNPAALSGFEIAADSIVVRIGREEGPEPEVFGSIPAAAFGTDGRIYAVDGQAHEIRVFGADGSYLSTFGRDGEGPGEFRSIDGLVRTPHGDLLVRDPRIGRASRFTADGAFLESYRLSRLWMQYSNRVTLWVDAGGRLFDRLTLSTSGPVDTVGIVSFAPGGRAADTTILAIREPGRVMITRGGMPYMALQLPFAPHPVAAVDSRGRIVTGDGASYRLARLGARGQVERWVEREASPRPVPDDAADSLTARVLRAVREVPGGEVGSYRLPEHQPYFTELLVDAHDNIWVAREGDFLADPVEYDVFDADGRFRGVVRTPPMRILGFLDDRVLGRQTDEDGVQSVIVVRVRIPTAS